MQTLKDPLQDGLPELEKYVLFFDRLWRQGPPLGLTFRTDRNAYIYDTGTNKILRCQELLFELLEDLLTKPPREALTCFCHKHGLEETIRNGENLLNCIQSHHILQLRQAKHFQLTSKDLDLDTLIRHRMEMIVLEVSTDCNLRCKYCTFNTWNHDYRNHGGGAMPKEIAFKALDILKNHSRDCDRVGVTFYGGEPLLEFPLIKDAVQYAIGVFDKKPTDFSLTTNGVLISSEIAAFLASHNIMTLVSIDGPQYYHDRFRCFPDGSGSFHLAVNGLKRLVSAYGERAGEKLKINMVYTPPWSSQRLDEISEMWNHLDWLPENIEKRIVYPNEGSLPAEFLPDLNQKEDLSILDWAFSRFRDYYNHCGEKSALAVHIMEPILLKFMKRPFFNFPESTINVNGCCVPGARRLFVSASGRFLPCEKIPTVAPEIGDVDHGVSLDAIREEYVHRYLRFSFPDCARCWASRFCDLCFRDAVIPGKLDYNKKSEHCRFEREIKIKYLKQACTLLEDNPFGLDYLMDRAIR